MTDKVLAAQDISVSFGRRRVLDRVSITVSPGEIVGLTGPSGTGKTTLAQVLTGLRRPDSGRVRCDGAELSRRHSGRIAMLFQSPRRSCSPRMTLRDTISELGRGPVDWDTVLPAAGMTRDLLDRYPSQVSDGQLQRAAVARVLAWRPDYIVCDEMTAMLDPATTATVVRTVTATAATGVGVLLIGHDLPLLRACTNRLVHLDGSGVTGRSEPNEETR
ncbi:ABC transporter ATP-binding protein [Nocardia mexicana]|uniref:Peptide/nickel transport system ATP-binding protein n=1 Tax=Nocardia mexicana TaxID=279262 RepID=A0A370H3H0_9NOCA|nr:ATP-binding cassette domain-containing protein [Nocardia mexicana]RDI50775.1 peptide/nickel transport system ATP-binding protein [Nocardia mexicana]